MPAFRHSIHRGGWAPVRVLVHALAAVAGLAVFAMMVVTCADIVGRQFSRPLHGAYDLVRIAGAIAIACALPLTTAVKGHVAIEYFFHRLGRTGRIVVDTVMRLLQMAVFALAAGQCVRYGRMLQRSGEVTPTLQLPVFWVPWVIALACAATVLVTLHHLLHPGRELFKP